MPSTCVVCFVLLFVHVFFIFFFFCHTRFSHFVLNFPPLFYVTLLHLLHVLRFIFIYIFIFALYNLLSYAFFLLHTKLLNFYLTLLCPKSRQKRWIRQKMGKKAGVRMRVWMGRLFTALRFTLHAHYTLPLAWCSVRAGFAFFFFFVCCG